MKHTDLETRLESAYASLSAPDVLESVLSDCPSKKGAIIMMHEHKKSAAARWAGIAAAFVLILGGAFGFGTYRLNHAVDATVSLDVNPSIELTANRSDRVLHVTANNADGQTILGNMDLSGSDLDVAINALIGSMVRNGYINELANSVLVSVDAADPARSAELQTRLTEEINTLLQTEDFSGSVLSQTIAQDHALQSTADEYGITLGKAQLIQEIIDLDATHTFDTLAALSINDLNLILHHGAAGEHTGSEHTATTIATTGTASDKAYIGAEAAMAAALEYAGIAGSDANYLRAEYDYERGVMVYEVDFTAGSYEYSIDVNAITGAIVSQEKEWADGDEYEDYLESLYENDSAAYDAALNTDHHSLSEHSHSTDACIGSDAAKAAALDHAGVAAEDAENLRCELDYDDGVPVYEIEFDAGLREYSYEIHAETGAVREHEKEWRD